MTIRLVSIGETDIYIHILTVPVIVLCVIMGQTHILLLTSLALFLHEICHIRAARRRGVSVYRIDILPCGASAHISECARSIRDTAAICASGVLFSLMCGIGIIGVTALMGFESTSLSEFALINTVIGAVNLLPAVPLDGGRVLFSLLLLRMKEKTATVLSVCVGLFVSSAALGLSIYGICTGILNFSALFLSALMLSGTLTQIKKRNNPVVRALRLSGITSGGKSVPVSIHAFGQGAYVGDVRTELESGKYNVVTVVDPNLRLVGILDESDLIYNTKSSYTLTEALNTKKAAQIKKRLKCKD